MHRLLFSLVLLLCCPFSALCAPEQWTEVKSPHFRVLTDGSAHQGQEVAAQFEQMRYVFSVTLPASNLDLPTPFTIFAGKDEHSIQLLLPEMGGPGPIAGMFAHGWERQFAWVRADGWGDNKQTLVYHEYTHSILHLNLQWMPLWLDEGLAEFYGYTRFLPDNTISIGNPSERFPVLRGLPLIPVKDLISGHSNPTLGAFQGQMFYAESWLLVHYLFFAPGMERGAKLARFYQALRSGEPQDKAFREVFGDPAQTDEALQLYIRNFTFKALGLAVPAELRAHDYPSRKLSLAETDQEHGIFEAGFHELAPAETNLRAAVAADPSLAEAHEELGFVLVDQGRDQESLKEFQTALAANPQLYRSLWAQTMLGPEPTTDEARAARRSALYQVLAIHPKFAPAEVELAKMDMARGDLKAALTRSRQAEQMEPWRAGYHLLSAEILLRAGFPKQAAEYAQLVAERWSGPDHNEAIELWDRIPAADRPEGVVLSYDKPKDAETAEGVVRSVTCTNELGKPKDRSVELTLDIKGAPQSFTTKKGFEQGMPDTLWYGEDHFSVCHHADGMPAVVFYKGGGASPHELLGVEFRSGALPSPAPAAAATTAPAADAGQQR